MDSSSENGREYLADKLTTLDIKKKVAKYTGLNTQQVGLLAYIQVLALHYKAAIENRKEYLLKASFQSYKKNDQLKYRSKYNSLIMFLNSLNEDGEQELSQEEAEELTAKQMTQHMKVFGKIFS